MGAMQAYGGGCHCGALTFRFETSAKPASLQRRACQCAFCRSHGAVTTSDPDGALRIDAEASALVRYRFALKTADFLICARCGVYVAALFEEGDDAWGIVNVNTLHEHTFFTAPIETMSYDGETVATRGERRKQRWTPVEAFNV